MTGDVVLLTHLTKVIDGGDYYTIQTKIAEGPLEGSSTIPKCGYNAFISELRLALDVIEYVENKR